MPAFSHQLAGRRRRAAGRRAVWASLPTGAPCASMPTASITASGPRPPVSSRTAPARSSCSLEVDRARRRARRARASRSGTRSTPITVPGAAVLGDAACHLADRAEAEDERRCRPSGIVRVLDRLPGGRQHVGEEEEAVVGRALGHLDRPVLGLRHAQVLGLAAGHLAVELGVAEQRGARAVLADLGRLALRLQALVAHEAVAAGDVERDRRRGRPA